MKTAIKISLITALCLIVAGAAIGFGAYCMVGGNFLKLSVANSKENTYTVDELFSKIRIDAAETDIQFVPSENTDCRVECIESDRVYHTVSVDNNTLTITRTDERKWYEHIGFFFYEMKITVYLPKDTYEELKLNTASGDISVPKLFCFDRAEINSVSGDIDFSAKVKEQFSAKTVSGDLTTSGLSAPEIRAETISGDINLSNANTKGTISAGTTSGGLTFSAVQCKELTAGTVSGEIEAADVIAENITCNSTSGDIELERCDADTLLLSAVSGDIGGSLLSDKIYSTDTTSGSVRVPKVQSGGSCNITTVSGDIYFK